MLGIAAYCEDEGISSMGSTSSLTANRYEDTHRTYSRDDPRVDNIPHQYGDISTSSTSSDDRQLTSRRKM